MISMTARQTVLLIVLFVITCVGLIVLDQQHRFDVAKGSTGRLIHPFVAVFNRAGDEVTSFRGRPSSDVERQLTAVTAERDHLLAENARLKQVEQEVTQLRQQLGFKQRNPGLTVVTANVLARDPNGTQKILVIDRGSNDGVRRGMAVISPDFFVGQVTDVDTDRARVTLAIDASARIGAMLQRSGADGVVRGRWQAGGQLELDHLDPKADVVEGDVVVTSGSTAGVPKGLVIGKVARISRNVQADTVTARVLPLFDYGTLQSVSVILIDDASR